MNHPAFDNIVLEQINLFMSNYIGIANYHFDSIDKKTILKDREVRCRFCGKSDLETTFKKDAHAIPQFIGNKYLVSTYECDICNEFFGETLENEMANFMKILHTLHGVKGKKKTPTYKSRQARIESSIKDIIVENIDDDLIIGNLNSKNFSIELKTDKFIPVAAYKCLTKIALSLIPETELVYFDKTLKWIREDRHDFSQFETHNLSIIYSQIVAQIEFPFISAIVLKRKNHIDSGSLPSYIFRISYSKNSFQINLPLCNLDDGKELSNQSLQYLPHLIDLEFGFDASERTVRDFSKTERCELPVKIEITNLNL